MDTDHIDGHLLHTQYINQIAAELIYPFYSRDTTLQCTDARGTRVQSQLS